MNTYLILKWVHILGSTILFGTGIGIAFFKWTTDRSKDINAIRIVNERTVWADWIFTTPAVILQPITGMGLVYHAGYSLSNSWVTWATFLYLFAGCCWLPVLKLQLVMRDLSRSAYQHNAQLPKEYWRYARIWFWLGVPAFLSLLVVYWLMIFKPAL